jgi:hypothetical protein
LIAVTETTQWRIAKYFEYWNARLTFIQSLDFEKYNHEANILIWSALDALAFAWAKTLGRQIVENASLRRTFDGFLAAYCPEPFGRVCLPDVWHRIARRLTDGLAADVVPHLQTAGHRVQPTALTRNCMRQVSDDPQLHVLTREILEVCPAADSKKVEIWLSLSRYGAIAYKRMRSPFVHEGRAGKDTHGFEFYNSAIAPTYLSSTYGTPAVLGFKPVFMVEVLGRCISAFEAEASSNGIDPVPLE